MCEIVCKTFKHGVAIQILHSRKRDRAKLHVGPECAPGVAAAVSTRFLLKWLLGKIEEESQTLMWGIIFWLSALIELSGKVCSASTDALDMMRLNFSIVGVKGRTKKISKAVKAKISKLGSRGDTFRSNRAVVRGLKILGGNKDMGGIAEKGTNRWTIPYVFQYIHCLQTTFKFEDVPAPVFSLAWDATRLSKLDVLICTIYNAALNLAGWCPPQVTVSFR